MRIEQFRLIAISGIAKDRHDRLAGAELFGEPDRAGHIDAGRTAEAKAFMFEQFVDDGNRFLVRYQIGLVDFGLLDDGGHAAKTDTFGDRTARRGLGFAVLEQFIHRSPMRIGATDHDSLVLLF